MPRDLHITINDQQCQSCRRCLAAESCKVRAILRIDRDEAPYLDGERCYDCRVCIKACPFGAVQVTNTSP